MSVLASGNKALLTELLTSLINENKFDYDEAEFNEFFSNTCKSFNEKRHEYDNLQQINQQIIGTCFNFLKNKNYLKPQIFERTQEQLLQEQYSIRKMNQPNNQNKNAQKRNFPPSNTIQLVHDNGEPYLQEDIKQKNRSEFDMKLKARQDNFNDTIAAKVPPAIDFTDQAQDGPMGNFNRAIDQTLEEREKELKRIMNEYGTENKKAEEWLKLNEKKEDGNQENNVEPNTENNTINISQSNSILKSSLDEPRKLQKRVSFLTENNTFGDMNDGAMSTFTPNTQNDIHLKIDSLANDVRELKTLLLELKNSINNINSS